MEERLVLDLRQALVVQVVAEHEAAWLICQAVDALDAQVATTLVRGLLIDSFLRLFNIAVLFRILLVRNGVLSRLLVELAFHKDIEEKRHSCKVCQLAADVCCPEEWMLVFVFCVGETNEIDSNVTDDTSLIESTTNSLANFCQVNLRQ